MIPRQPLTLRRDDGDGSYVDGIWVPDSDPQEIPFFASIQPATGKDLEALPEGRRETQSFVLFTDTALRTVKEGGSGRAPDIVEIYGEDHEISHVETWGNQILPHYRAIATKRNTV